VLKLTQKHIHALCASKFEIICWFTFGDDMLINSYITPVEKMVLTPLSSTTTPLKKNSKPMFICAVSWDIVKHYCS